MQCKRRLSTHSKSVKLVCELVDAISWLRGILVLFCRCVVPRLLQLLPWGEGLPVAPSDGLLYVLRRVARVCVCGRFGVRHGLVDGVLSALSARCRYCCLLLLSES